MFGALPSGDRIRAAAIAPTIVLPAPHGSTVIEGPLVGIARNASVWKERGCNHVALARSGQNVLFDG